MKLTNLFKSALCVLGAAGMVACSGGGSCPPGQSTGDVTLKLTAPNQYPAGVAVTAYLTMTNTSNVNASNLYYAIPSATNYTGTTITVANGFGNNPCFNIAAGASCTFQVQLTNNPVSHPGSFTVTATPNGSASQSTTKKLWSSLKSDIGLQAGTLSLTANIGLTTVPPNTNSDANGITFLYSQTIASNKSGDTLLSIVGVVNSATAGAFNTINLTDQSGNPLTFSVSSGNSGQGATNLGLNSIVTFLLTIPSSAANSTLNFYAQTAHDGVIVNQGTIANPITVGSATAGVLVVQPTDFSLTAPNYESQVVIFTNIGNGPVSGLIITSPTNPLYEIIKSSNNCTGSLAVGASCTYVLGSHAEAGFSGDAGFTASYNNGSATAYVAAQVHYAGVDPVAGISITSPTLNFVASTENTSVSSQLTLTNSGNVSESDFVFTVPEHFTLSAGTTGTPCVLSGNTVTTVLAKATSCTLTLTYTNATLISQQLANLLVNYKFHGVAAPQSSTSLTYQTVQASAVLQVSSPALPYTFPNIRANGKMSESQVYIYTNIGTGTATNVTVEAVLQGGGTVFNVIPSQPSTANDCGSSITSLAPSATCQVTVQFGPTASPANTYTEYLPVSYESIPATTPVVLTTTLNGTLLPANSANIIVSAVSLSPTALGGDGTLATPFAFESSTPSVSITITYKNIGNDVAQNFTLDGSYPPIGTITVNNCNNVTLAINGTCTATVNYITMVGGAGLFLGAKYMPITWTDDRGNMGPVGAQWDNNGVYQSSVNLWVYDVPKVTAMMSYESSGANPISSVKAESDFYVVYQLTGGYNVAPMNYGVNLTNAGGGTPKMAVVGSPTCSLSSQQVTCFIQLNAGGAAQNQVIGYYTTTGSVTPSPTTSGNFNVVQANQGRYIFITKGTYNGDLQHGGGNTSVPGIPAPNGPTGGSSICNYEAYQSGSIIPPGLTFMAVILDDDNLSGSRTPCGSTGCGGSGAGYASDWPIAANTAYRLTNGTFFMTSNQYGVFEYTYAKGAILDQTGNAAPEQQFWIGMSGMLVESIIPVPAPIPGWTASSTQPTSWPYVAGMWSNTVQTCNNWTSSSQSYSGYTGDNGDFDDSKYGVTGLTNFGFSSDSFPAGVSNNTFTQGVFPSRWNAQNKYSCNLAKPLICVQVEIF